MCRCWLGQGDGTLAAGQRFAVGAVPRAVTVGDFNGDGRLDLATANTSSSDVSVLLGQGTGRLRPNSALRRVITPWRLQSGTSTGMAASIWPTARRDFQ